MARHDTTPAQDTRTRPDHTRVEHDQADTAQPSAPLPRSSSPEPSPVPGNLPAELDAFIGRHRALAEGKHLLRRARLLTLTGPGGIGKTRLALRLAAELAQDCARPYPDGVWLISLGELTRPDQVTAALLDAFTPRPDNLDALLAQLLTQRLLLVFDNCEHLLAAVADLLRQVLRSSAGVRVLATSRTCLQLPGEHLQPVPPLGTGDPADPDDERRCEALQLLTAQARVVNAELGDDEHADALRLCRLLDGVPLAITLAATRLRSMSVRDLADRVAAGEGCALLDTGQHHGQPSHRTLAAAHDWSYNLCTPAEKCLWDRLSVFAGAFDPRSAEAVCADDELTAEHLPRLLARLVDQSVLLADTTGGTTRYRMLTSVRAAGAARLDEHDGRRLRQAHAEHYLDLARQATDAVSSDHEGSWISRVQREIPHLTAAVGYFLDHGEPVSALELAVEVARTRWAFATGELTVARDLLGRALAAQHTPHPLQVAAHVLATHLDLCQGNTARAERELAAAETINNRLGAPAGLRPWSLTGQGLLLLFTGEARGIAVLRQAHELWQQADYPGHDFLPLATAMIGDALIGDAPAAFGHPDPGERTFATSVTELGQEWTQWCRAVTELRHGDIHLAAELLADTTRRHLHLGDRWGTAWSLEALAWATAACGHNEHAAVLFGAAQQHRPPNTTITDGAPAAALHNRWTTTTRARLGEAPYGASVTRGTALDHASLLTYLLELPDPAQHSSQFPGDLTEREYEIAGLIAAGLTNKQIATKLTVSVRTVDTHGESIRHKLGFFGTGSRTKISHWWGELHRR
ncbi:helix-turn-helix transcriptional regulator [Lentzea sp. CA-135723]|uniref:helix-turn-helix transcriptional regulator n=1 Tax=Lentzea sp. CA-135723 TaxID=3239950 RepID=UPI003D9086AF